MPSYEQIIGAVRIILTALFTAALTYAANHNWIDSASVTTFSVALVTLVLAAWSIVGNSLASRATSVANSGGTKVVVSASAPQALKELASDPAVPNVEHAK